MGNSLSAAWTSAAMTGKLKLAAYFLFPVFVPLSPGAADQHALLELMRRMEGCGISPLFPNSACQYGTLVQKVWSAHLSSVPSFRLPATTRVPLGLVMGDASRAAETA